MKLHASVVHILYSLLLIYSHHASAYFKVLISVETLKLKSCIF